MSRMIFPNLAVSDLQRSVDWTGIGFSFDPRLGDDNAACTMVGERASVSAESRAEVDRIVDRALATGGARSREPQDVAALERQG
ncbi:MAG: VOC family protein [Nocardioidaceae bacterium]